MQFLWILAVHLMVFSAVFGLLRVWPYLQEKLHEHRNPWPRPRRQVGETFQNFHAAEPGPKRPHMPGRAGRMTASNALHHSTEQMG
ncbi:DUF3088 domain-containing protein [Lignipirellula cremea]|uniref:Uncharacterized protein n=1 Tax=Lignipirellula cremea TaxID=2528010 RepID=A0A518DUG3_9BACT|nr:DUF3088 domain-containing protein [Lignipirellula cremea]QDU95476.1 hypothetical protein Pla8534_32910 [Lignipirellula cremea]